MKTKLWYSAKEIAEISNHTVGQINELRKKLLPEDIKSRKYFVKNPGEDYKFRFAFFSLVVAPSIYAIMLEKRQMNIEWLKDGGIRDKEKEIENIEKIYAPAKSTLNKAQKIFRDGNILKYFKNGWGRGDIAMLIGCSYDTVCKTIKNYEN